MSPLDLKGRHLDEAPARQAVVWNCPACGGQNVSPLELGCPACGAGQPGYKAPEVATPPPAPVAPVLDPLDSLLPFEAWLSTRRPAEQQLRNLLEAAYRAGYEAGRAAGPPAQALAQETFRAEGTVARTLAAALTLWLDQMVPVLGEEMAAGQYCTAEEIRGLIRQYQASEGA